MDISLADWESVRQVSGIFVAILVLCMCALGMIRMMGSRTVGQLAPLDFVIMVGLGDIIVTTAMDCQQNFWGGIAGLLALLVLQRLLSYFSLKSTICRRLFEGVPVVLIRDGRLLRKNFSKTRFNYDDLRQELHKLGMDMRDLPKIKLARLESCGVFTVIKNSDMEGLTKQDVSEFFKTIDSDPLHPVGREWQRFSRILDELEEFLTRQKD